MKTFAASTFLVLALATTKAFSQCATLPPAPHTTNDTITSPGGFATLTASGDSVRWYDSAEGGIPVATGDTFVTPLLNETTTYYAANVNTDGGQIIHGGKLNHAGTLFAANNNQNAHMQFNVLNPSTLVTVKVYTDFPGERVIQLFDAGNNLIAFDTVDVQADSMVLLLNFPLTPGTGYYLTTDSAVNRVIPNNNNYSGPRFRRNSSNISYPYNVDTLVSITGNNTNNAQYFYFYDWAVQTPFFECESERAAAEVYYDNSVGMSDIIETEIALYPNPATNSFNIRVDAALSKASFQITDVSGRVVLEQKLNGENEHNIDVSSLSTGVYLVTLQTQTQTSVTKLLIQR